jgi:hypothetical protein
MNKPTKLSAISCFYRRQAWLISTLPLVRTATAHRAWGFAALTPAETSVDSMKSTFHSAYFALWRSAFGERPGERTAVAGSISTWTSSGSGHDLQGRLLVRGSVTPTTRL